MKFDWLSHMYYGTLMHFGTYAVLLHKDRTMTEIAAKWCLKPQE